MLITSSRSFVKTVSWDEFAFSFVQCDWSFRNCLTSTLWNIIKCFIGRAASLSRVTYPVHYGVCMVVFEFFPKLTDLTFLSFLYKIDITGFQNQQKKIASTGYWTHNTNPTIRISVTLTTQPPRHLLNRISLNWTWIISGSTEHNIKKSLKVWGWHGLADWLSG